jgi:protein-S-isoprenylcysteine O-methyltransferase Ste14
MNSLELKIPPLVVLVAFGMVAFALSLVIPSMTFTLAHSTVIAGAIAIAGIGVALAGVIAFHRSGTTVNPTTPEKSLVVVSTGIYRFTRNPMYLGFALVFAGLATYLSNAASLLMLPLFIGYLTKFQIKPEERVLLAKFGAPLHEYMATLRRWI